MIYKCELIDLAEAYNNLAGQAKAACVVIAAMHDDIQKCRSIAKAHGNELMQETATYYETKIRKLMAKAEALRKDLEFGAERVTVTCVYEAEDEQ